MNQNAWWISEIYYCTDLITLASAGMWCLISETSVHQFSKYNSCSSPTRAHAAEWSQVIVFQTEVRERVVDTCCVGHAPDRTGTRCTPVCSGCVNGVCMAPDSCHCQPGYAGDNCDTGKKHVACTGKVKMWTKCYSEIVNGGNSLRYLRIDRRVLVNGSVRKLWGYEWESPSLE